MAKRAVEVVFDGGTSTTPYASYDSTKINLGPLIIQDGTNDFAGPLPVVLGRPMEQTTSFAVFFPHAIAITTDLYWIFCVEAPAGATKRVMLYTYVPSTTTLNWKGFVTLTLPTATNHTVRGFRVVRHTYTTGTVAVSGTGVTGTTTAWTTARFAAGARIGFGSTDPTAITTWYHISSITNDTTITLVENAGTIGAGSTFVIEELRVVLSTTNATAANGGLFLAKGVNYDDFTGVGTTIAAATNTDLIKACYWLADAATVLNTVAIGLAITTPASNTSHIVYVPNLDSSTTLRVYKYDIRASLGSLSSGKETSAFLYKTGIQTVVATVSQTNSCRLATLSHGPGSGVSSIYFCSTTRIYRIPETDIINSSTNFIADVMGEFPTGNTNTFAATASFSSVEYASSIDRLIVTTGASFKQYVTKYSSNANALFDHVWGCNNFQIDQSTADSGLTPYPSVSTAAFSIWVENGIAFIIKNGTAVTSNFLYITPLGADWTYAATTNNRLITPEISTSDARLFYKVCVNSAQYLGSANLGLPPEPYRIYARTSGITNNTGDWVLLDQSGDLSGFAASTSIQVMLEFKVIGLLCIPARIYNICVVYEDNSTNSHYQPSVGNSSISSTRFAWRFSTAYGGTVPTLTIKIYNAVTGNLILCDTTASQAYGTFEKSTNDGSAWGSYNTTDKGNDTTYIRYTPSSFPTSIKARAILI